MGRRRRLIALAAVAWLGMAMLTLGFVGRFGAAADYQSALSRVASMPLPDGVSLDAPSAPILDPVARRALVVCDFGCNPNQVASMPFLLSFDMDTHTLVKTVPYSAVSSSFLNIYRSYAVDPSHQRIYLAIQDPTASDPGNTAPTTIAIINSRTLAIEKKVFVAGSDAGTIGFYYSQADGVLYMATMKTPSLAETAEIVALDPNSLTQLWTASIGSTCKALMPGTKSPTPLGEYTVDGQASLYTVCSLNGSPQAPPRGVVRVALPAQPSQAKTAPALTVDAFPGIIEGQNSDLQSYFVPADGRMVSMVGNRDGSSTGVYVFDPRTATYVAEPTLFSTGANHNLTYFAPNIGIDPSSGRVYGHSFEYAQLGAGCYGYAPNSNVFAMAEAGLVQNATTQVRSADELLNDGASGELTFDPVHRELWEIDQPRDPNSGCSATGPFPQKAKLVVFHDNIPPVKAGNARNWDAPTTDMQESSSTGFNASTQASAYGAHYALAPSGIEGTFSGTTEDCNSLESNYNAFAGLLSRTGQSFPAFAPMPAQYHAFCNSNPRDITFAHVLNASLDGSEARAAAIAADTGADTARDVSNATNISNPTAYPQTSVGWLASLCAAAGQQVDCSMSSVLQAVCAQDKISSSQCSVGAVVAKGCTDNGLPTTPSPSASPSPIDDTTRALCQMSLPYLTGENPPFTPAACNDDGTAPQDPGVSHTNQASGGSFPQPLPVTLPGASQTTCNFVGNVAYGRAEMNGANLDAPVFANTAFADARAGRDAVKGSTASADSIVNGIDIFGLVQIGRLEVHATANAHGRPGTNSATYTCTVSHVVINPLATSIPGPTPTSPNPTAPAPIQFPGTYNCDDQALHNDIDQLNHQLTGLLQIEFPSVQHSGPTVPDDDVVLRVSPKGYIAQIAASKVRQNSDALMVNERMIEEPALLVTYINDSSSEHSRFEARFGGVALASAYGIYSQGDFSGGGDTGSVDNSLPLALPSSAPVGNLDNGPQGGGTPPQPPLGNSGGNNGGGGPINQAIQAIVDGINVLRQHPELIPPLLAVWALLGLPGYLASRRYALVAATSGRGA